MNNIQIQNNDCEQKQNIQFVGDWAGVGGFLGCRCGYKCDKPSYIPCSY